MEDTKKNKKKKNNTGFKRFFFKIKDFKDLEGGQKTRNPFGEKKITDMKKKKNMTKICNFFYKNEK